MNLRELLSLILVCMVVAMGGCSDSSDNKSKVWILMGHRMSMREEPVHVECDPSIGSISVQVIEGAMYIRKGSYHDTVRFDNEARELELYRLGKDTVAIAGGSSIDHRRVYVKINRDIPYLVEMGDHVYMLDQKYLPNVDIAQADSLWVSYHDRHISWSPLGMRTGPPSVQRCNQKRQHTVYNSTERNSDTSVSEVSVTGESLAP